MTKALKTARGAFFALLSVFGFASTFVAGDELTKVWDVSPSVLALLRFAIAGGTMLAIGLPSRRLRARLAYSTRVNWRRLAVLGPIGTAFMAWCVFRGCSCVPVANASMADALTPLGIFVFTAITTRRATPLQLAGLAMGFAGALLTIKVLGPGGLAISEYGIGDAFILMSATAWGAYSALGRRDIVDNGAFSFTTITMLVGCAAILVVLAANHVLGAAGACHFEIVWPHGVRAWSLVAFLGLVCTLLPFWTWNAAQHDLPLSVLAVSAYFTPVAALLVEWAFKSANQATAWQWLGTLLICAAAVVESGRDHGKE